MIEWGEKIAAVVCRHFQKRAVIKGSYGRKNSGDTNNKTTYTKETERQHKGYQLKGKKKKKTKTQEEKRWKAEVNSLRLKV